MLKVVNGINKVNKHELYYKAYCRVVLDQNSDWLVKLKKVVFYGVKTINTLRISDTLTTEEKKEDIEYYFQLVSTIMDFMALLTPAELINVFTIIKDYDGDKYGTKDYFYTRTYLERIGLNKPIGEEITNLLWEYHNHDVRMFCVKMTSFMSDIRRLQGESGIMEEWAADNEIRTVSTFTDSKGKRYQLDETGKTTRVKKPRPRYLKIVK